MKTKKCEDCPYEVVFDAIKVIGIIIILVGNYPLTTSKDKVR